MKKFSVWRLKSDHERIAIVRNVQGDRADLWVYDSGEVNSRAYAHKGPFTEYYEPVFDQLLGSVWIRKYDSCLTNVIGVNDRGDVITDSDELLTMEDFLCDHQLHQQARPADLIGRKDDTGKLRMDLIPPHAEQQMAAVLTFGADKYGPNNWSRLPDAQARYMAAALRHINAHRTGERLDDETGLPHLAHAMTCLAFLLELES